MLEKTQTRSTSTASTSIKLQHSSTRFLTVSEVAKLLNKPSMTITRWCQSGRLPAFEKPYGSKATYLISQMAVEILKAELGEAQEEAIFSASQVVKPHSDLIEAWIISMQAGTLNGKRYSPLTIDDYAWFVRKFIDKHQTVTAKNLQTALCECGGKYSVRFKIYKSVVCFSKYLKREGLITDQFFSEIKTFFPKRDTDPKRVSVDEEDLFKLLEHCNKPIETALIVMMASTGLRVSEICRLQLEDIQLDKQILTAKSRKSGKTTSLGLNSNAVSTIKAYRDSLPAWMESSFVFVDEEGNPLTRMGVYHRLKRLSKRAGIPVHPHALRRAFVTINAGKGRPLVYLQRACGHSDIKTTMDYCRTSDREVIEAMKNWD